MSLEQIKQKISPILQQYRVEYAGVFGSQARQDARSGSDVDILVRFQKTPSLVQFIRLENQLSQTLGKKVDLATEQSLHRLIKADVLKDLKTIYED